MAAAVNVIDALSLVCRWVHILSVAVVVGGAIVMRFAVMPTARAALPTGAHQDLRQRLLARWRKLVHVGIALLIITGGYNFYVAIVHEVPPMPYHAVFGVKFLIALAVFFLAIALTGRSPGFQSLRAQSEKWMNVQIALAVVIIVLSGLLKTFHQAALAAPEAG